jgi:hypothetical protein
VVYKAYITGREFNDIQSVYLGAAKVRMLGKDVQFDGFDPTTELAASNKMVELMVVSVKGPGVDPATSLLDQVLDLPASDYQEVIDVLSVASGKKKRSKPLRPRVRQRSSGPRHAGRGHHGAVRMDV